MPTNLLSRSRELCYFRTPTTSFGKLPICSIPVSMLSVDDCSTHPLGRLWRALPPYVVEVTTMLYLLQFLTRVFEVGAFVAIFFVVAFLLESEVIIGWVCGFAAS